MAHYIQLNGRNRSSALCLKILEKGATMNSFALCPGGTGDAILEIEFRKAKQTDYLNFKANLELVPHLLLTLESFHVLKLV